MNIEALIVIGVVSVGLVIIFYIPGILWARCKLKHLPDNAVGHEHITKFGMLYYILLLCLVSAAVYFIYLKPGLSPWIRLTILACAVAIGLSFAVIADKLGYKISTKFKKSEKSGEDLG